MTEDSKRTAEVRKHIQTEYKGFTICEGCDTIMCPLNTNEECRPKAKRGARAYIDCLRAAEKSRDGWKQAHHEKSKEFQEKFKAEM